MFIFITNKCKNFMKPARFTIYAFCKSGFLREFKVYAEFVDNGKYHNSVFKEWMKQKAILYPLLIAYNTAEYQKHCFSAQ